MLDNIAFAFFPLPLSIGLLLAGLVLMQIKERQRLGKGAIALGFLVLAVASNPVFADWAISRLEGQYPPFGEGPALAERLRGTPPRYVVVLAGKLNDGAGLAPSSRLGAAMLMRLTEGIRLHRAIGDSKLILSGGNPHGKTEAAAMTEMAVMLGVPREDIIEETKSQTTYEEARLIKQMVGTAPIVLVTSASHMPRAMRLFRRAGIEPMAAPTGHLRGDVDYGRTFGLIPSSSSLATTSGAVYEVLALFKAKILGRL